MFTFADSFDFYTGLTDPLPGYWDGGNFGSSTVAVFGSGRFTGQSIGGGSTGGSVSVWLYKNSGNNDAVHHIVCAFNQVFAFTGTTAGVYLQLCDGATGQCCVVFRSDGAILLTSGGPTGTTLATYASGVTMLNAWLTFEFEVVIHNTAGSFTVRKNGNTSNDFAASSLNTRGGTANNYANRLQVGNNWNNGLSQKLDDLLWRSDPTSVAWMGDIRSYVRMPASDASVQFARPFSTFVQQQAAAFSSTVVRTAGSGMMGAFTPNFSGTITSGTVSVAIGGTANMKVAIYDSTRTVVLATSNAVVNPISGNVPITFIAPLTVTKGTTYHLATDQDATLQINGSASTQWFFNTPYANFPTASPTLSSGSGPVFTLNIPVIFNADFVGEAQQDGTASYVYDSTVGHADLYNIAAASPAPTSVVAVTTRGFVEKSDAGARSGAVQLKSGVTTAQSTSTPLTSSFTWLYRTDNTDPNTGSAWTPAAVDGMQIGPVVTA